MPYILRFFLIALVLTSCAPIYVNYDFEEGTHFANYKTYNYYSPMETGLSDLDSKRLLNTLDMQLSKHGLSRSQTPDFLINIQSRVFQGDQQTNVGVGLGGGSRGVIGGGLSIGMPLGRPKVTREIVFHFVDEKKQGLFWEAVSQSTFNPNASPEKRKILIQNIVSKVLAKYPPKPKR